MTCRTQAPLLLLSLVLPFALLTTTHVEAAPGLRKQIDQRGDFVLIGNAGGFECAPGTPLPTTGTVTCPAAGNLDTSPDVFWRSEEPTDTSAVANASITVATARTTALLSLPALAKVSYARVYWAGFLSDATPVDNTLRIERPASPLNSVVLADASFVADRGAFYWYQATADVTALVSDAGPGLFRVSDIATVDLPSMLANDDPILAWSMVVFYELGSDPPRDLALFDGLDYVAAGAPASATLNGFLVPNAGFDAKLGVVAYEGENQNGGDSFRFNGVPLFDAINPVANFFNGSHGFLGNAVSTAGDLPRAKGTPGSLSGLDLDVVDVKARLKPKDTSATIQATSTGDTFLLGAFVTSISTFKPDFAASKKSFTDLDGGGILPGDELEYAIVVANEGNDASVGTVMTDALPSGISYKPGSLRVISGANAGLKSDAKDADQGEYDALTRTIRVRVGTGASGLSGGAIALGATSEIRFVVTVDADATGSIQNQAVVTGGGKLGAPPSDFPTDGNGDQPGSPPTSAVIDKCSANSDCKSPAPTCDLTASPKVCVGCLSDADCGDPTAAHCNGTTHLCGCFKNCSDSDGDGIPDDVETALGTDPHDADSDDDGVVDGQEPDAALDTDGDGLINALDPDSDNDGLFDGTELGLDCASKDTNALADHCRGDADKGKTTTNPLAFDTDGGGASDGSEDANLDGALDASEGDPSSGHPADDKSIADSDRDGLGDLLEATLGSDPMDADSDDDGVRDGQEANPSDDTDGDGLRNVSDVDSDNDGLFDGTERGKACDDPATHVKGGHCIADADKGKTITSSVNADTDRGGVKDGSEDFNRNGALEKGEADPTLGHGADDASVKDSDGDGMSDGLEQSLGADPKDADSDNDGVLDGAEPNPSDDGDGDGKINALDPDSDNDGLFDGLEVGNDCQDVATDPRAMVCVPDADKGVTRTSPLVADTDHGGVIDGAEDANHNGVVDTGETDPNDSTDEHRGVGGSGGAGGASNAGGSGGGAGGNGRGGNNASGGSAADGGASVSSTSGVLEGGGCTCRAAPAASAPYGGFVLALGSLLLLRTRRRRSAHREARRAKV